MAAMLMVIILLNLTGNGYPVHVIRLDTMSSFFSRVKTVIKSE